MPDITTYSFADVVAVFSHALVGQKSVNGLGIGSITVAYADNLTENDLGADGSVMITKVLSRRGTITLEIQQTSSLNKWLLNFANAVVNAGSSSWANMLFSLQEKFTNGVTVNASSLALLKRPDRKDEQNGGRVTWEFFSPTIAEA
jgi:hypothetical protein